MTRLALPSLGLVRQRDPYQLDEQERESLLTRVARPAVGGLAAVGNILDLPGSMVRDVLAWENPVDQLLPWNWTTAENRTTGRDLLRQYGMAGRRNTWGNFGAGLAAEIALDPLTYMTFGASALGKGGRVAKAAGLLDDPMRQARFLRQTGRPGGMGPREFRQTQTLQDVINAAGPAGSPGRKAAIEAARKAAPTMGVDNIGDVLRQPLGGSVGFQVPFTNISGTLPVSQRSLAAARLGDRIGQGIRASVPGRVANRLFNKASQGAQTMLGQLIGEKATAGNRMATELALERVFPLIETFHRAKVFNPSEPAAGGIGRQLANENSMAAVRYLEEAGEGWDQLPPTLRPYQNELDRMKEMQEEIIALEQGVGLNTKELNDDWIRYFTRKVATAPGGPARLQKGLGQAIQTKHPYQLGRNPLLTNLYGGTADLQKLSLSELSGLKNDKTRFDEWLRNNNLVGLDEDISRGRFSPAVKSQLLGKVDDILGPQARANFADEGAWEDHAVRLANWAMGLPAEHHATKTPIFNIDPLESLIDRMRHSWSAVKGFEAMHDLLGEVAQRDPERIFDRRPHSVLQTLGKSNLKTPIAKKAVYDRLAENTDIMEGWRDWPRPYKPPADVDIDALLDADYATLSRQERRHLEDFHDHALDHTYIPEDIAKDVERYTTAFKLPDEIQQLAGGLDWFTNLWRFGVTAPWPSFHSRNFVSGQFQNWIGKAFDPDAKGPMRYIQPILDADAMLRLRNVRGDATGAETREIIRLSFKHGILDERHGQAAADLADTGRVAGQIPGLEPSAPNVVESVRRGLSESVPRNWAQANPLNMQGVNVTGAEDVFAPGRVMRKAGQYTEALNRLAPFRAYLKQGMAPAEAARRVKKLQVDYTSLTGFEREVMRRAVPFYSFSSRVMPFVLEELTQRPAGRLGQTIRTIRGAQQPDPFAPEYVTQTAAVPFGENQEGTGRYLTGFGLMPEDPLSFASGGGLELLSRVNPAIKGPLELITGQTFFQRGPTGTGRSLEDLDPPIGRTIQNLAVMAGAEPRTRARPFISGTLENILSQLPTSRAVTSLRTLTDPRKGIGSTAANLLTGLRITDVPVAARERRAQQLAENLMRQMGAASFEKIYFPEEELAEMPPARRILVDQLRALQQEMEQKRRERREARQKQAG